MIKIKVPATTANIGAGFDCFGMALNLYNELLVEKADKFSITGTSVVTEDNLIYQVITRFFNEIDKPLPPIKLTQTDNIPMTRGLGSSSACIVAGLFAANELAGRPKTKDELAQMACAIEGHPDNVAPAVYGGLVIAVLEGEERILHHVKIEPSEQLSFITFIPDFRLSTAKARRILPSAYTRADAIFNISRAALFVAGMMSHTWENLRVAVDDIIHQPYRGVLIPGMDELFDHAKNEGAKGVFLSGAGPTVIAIVMREHEKEFAEKMQNHLKTFENNWETKILHADLQGVQIL